MNTSLILFHGQQYAVEFGKVTFIFGEHWYIEHKYTWNVWDSYSFPTESFTVTEKVFNLYSMDVSISIVSSMEQWWKRKWKTLQPGVSLSCLSLPLTARKLFFLGLVGRGFFAWSCSGTNWRKKRVRWWGSLHLLVSVDVPNGSSPQGSQCFTQMSILLHPVLWNLLSQIRCHCWRCCMNCFARDTSLHLTISQSGHWRGNTGQNLRLYIV